MITLLMPISATQFGQDTNSIIEPYRPQATDSTFSNAAPKRWDRTEPKPIKDLSEEVIARLVLSRDWVAESKVQSLFDFAAKFAARSSDLDPEFAKILRDNFWDLL